MFKHGELGLDILIRRAHHRRNARIVQVVAVKAVVRRSTVKIGQIRATVNNLKRISSIWVGLFILAGEEGSYTIYRYSNSEFRLQNSQRLCNEAKSRKLATLRDEQTALDEELASLQAEWALSGAILAIMSRELSGCKYKSRCHGLCRKLAVPSRKYTKA